MRALIRTHDVYGGNYGCVLQAFALQRALREMGVEAFTDVSAPPSLRRNIAPAVRTVRRFSRPGSTPPSGRAASRLLRDPVSQFVDNNMSVTRLHGRWSGPNPGKLSEYDAFIVGSDQVWRPSYVDVETNLLSFAHDINAKKLSYAASFGTAEHDSAEVRTLRRHSDLAQRFDGHSVREDSAVDMCREYWGVTAVHVPDPTMLLEPSVYSAISETSGVETTHGLRTYLLDPTPAKRDAVQAHSQAFDLHASDIVPPAPSTQADLLADRSGYRRPTLPSWLRAMSEAEYVVTDSFHGAVFCLLLNRPFTALVNPKRGSARFESLLGEYNLTERMVYSGTQVPTSEIDWAQVNTKLDERRRFGLDFLRSHLCS